MITKEALQQAASKGEGLDHLSAGQVYAAVSLAMTPEQLRKPLAAHIALLLESIEQHERKRFFDGVEANDAMAMIARAFDDAQAPFLYMPIRKELEDERKAMFPDIKPIGVDDEGNPVFSLANIADSLGTSEEELIQFASDKGMPLHPASSPINKLH